MDEQLNIEVNLNGIKSLKTELKEANLEYQKLLNSSSATAEQIEAAARKVGRLKEEIGDAAETAKALGSTEGKIAAIGNAAQVGVSAFQGIQASMALVGVESSALEETMVKLQAIMSLQQAIGGLSKAGDAFTNLGKIGKQAFGSIRSGILATGIGIFIVALGTIIANFDDIKAAAEKMFPALKNTGALFDKVKQVVMGLGTAIKDYIFTPFKFLGKLIQGDIQGALKELQSGLNVVSNYKKGAAKEEADQEKKKQDELLAIRAAANAEQDKQNKEARAKIDAANKEAAAKAKAKAAKAAEDKAEADRLKAEIEKTEKEHLDRMFELNATDKEKEEAKIEDYYKNLISYYKKNKMDITQLEKDKVLELEKINQKYNDKNREEELKAQEDKAKILTDAYSLIDELGRTAEENELAKVADYYSKLYEAEGLSEEERLKIKEDWKKKEGEVSDKYRKDELDKEKKLKEDKKQLDLAEIDMKKRTADAYIEIVAGIGNIISTFAGKNKKAAKVGVLIEKAASVASIVANTAAAIAKANKDIPFPGNIPVGIAYGVSGAAGIASTIMGAKQALAQIDGTGGADGASKGSKYEKGGLLMGRKHSEGGIMTNFGELEGGEFVVNRSATKNFLPLLEKINAGGGSGAPNNLSTQFENNNATPIIKTYVVASDVTSQQEVERKIANLARL